MKITDFHSHILPRADHGSDSSDTSIRQLKMALEAGVDRIVATPHFYPNKHTVEKFLARRENAFASLKERLAGEDITAEIVLASEVLICHGIENLEGIEKLCIQGTRAILMEFPLQGFSNDYVESIETLVRKGFDVVVAHADRYDADNIERLVQVGAKIQLNASAIATLFKKKHLFDWMERGLVVGLGSDIHMLDKTAYRDFKKALKKINVSGYGIMEASEKLIAAAGADC